MITLIHGPAELLRAEALAALRTSLIEDETLADLNTTQLDGQHTSVAELEGVCATLPFLAGHRVVIVDGLLRKLATASKPVKGSEGADSPESTDGEAPEPEAAKGQAKKLADYLERTPTSTELIFTERDTIGGGVVLRRIMELQRDGRARITLCQNPRRNELPDWIRARARLRKVRLEAQAVADLADFIGDDLRQIDQELIKLADYAGSERTITTADIRSLVPATRAANVFEMMDALGSGDSILACRMMQHALDVDNEQPLRLLGMIARQHRLLIQAKALQAQGVRQSEIANQLNIQEWTAPKLISQASRYSFAALHHAMEQILDADEAIKTGRRTEREAMELLLADLLPR